LAEKKSEKSLDRHLVKRLYAFIKPYRWWVVLTIGLTLFASWLGTIRPKLTQIAVDEPIAQQDPEGLLRIIYLLVAALVGEFILLVFNTYITRWFGQNSLFNLRNAVFQKIESLHVQYFDRNPIGKLITRTTSDIEALSDLLSDGVVSLIGDLFRIFFILYFMLMMSWELTIISVLVLPLLFYSTFWFKNKMRVAFLEVRDQIARLNSFIQEHISGISVVQLFNRQKRVSESFKDTNEEHKKAHVKTIFYFSIFWPVVEVLASVAMALVVWYGGARALSGTVTFGVLLAFIQYVRQFFQPIRGISEKYNTLQSALASSERIFSILDTPSDITSPEKPHKLEEVKGKIEFKHVWFRYDKEGSYILQDVSFTASPGEMVAIVGATGAGKSTIINLVTRFYDIEKGEILLDGVDIRNLRIEDLRQQFALVLQDNALFSGTIEKNITLGNPEITMDKIRESAIEVGADSFISKLPDGYQTVLRERGASLSLGQRQLLCFVRAKVYDPKILVLDEATSSIDSESEDLISKACERMMKDRTSIVIAHRLSTIQSADKILVMHKGRIVETGTHEELLKLHGVYHRLYELQYQEQAVLNI
jgi:ATP-binding cassette subfamily B protein